MIDIPYKVWLPEFVLTKISLLFMKKKVLQMFLLKFPFFQNISLLFMKKKILGWNLKSGMWLELSSYVTYLYARTDSRCFYNSSFWEYAWSQLELLCNYLFIWTGSVCSFKFTLSENQRHINRTVTERLYAL